MFSWRHLHFGIELFISLSMMATSEGTMHNRTVSRNAKAREHLSDIVFEIISALSMLIIIKASIHLIIE